MYMHACEYNNMYGNITPGGLIIIFLCLFVMYEVFNFDCKEI